MSNDRCSWIVVVYRLPARPTRYRAWLWRQVKRLGGVYLQDGVFVVPDQGDMELEVQALLEEVAGCGGSAQAVVGQGFSPGIDAQLVGRFNAERDAEYRLVLAAATRLRDYFQEEESHWDFSAAEVRRLREELGRLWRRFRHVQGRDYFQAPTGKEARQRLEECEARLSHR